MRFNWPELKTSEGVKISEKLKEYCIYVDVNFSNNELTKEIKLFKLLECLEGFRNLDIKDKRYVKQIIDSILNYFHSSDFYFYVKPNLEKFLIDNKSPVIFWKVIQEDNVFKVIRHDGLECAGIWESLESAEKFAQDKNLQSVYEIERF